MFLATPIHIPRVVRKRGEGKNLGEKPNKVGGGGGVGKKATVTTLELVSNGSHTEEHYHSATITKLEWKEPRIAFGIISLIKIVIVLGFA